ncbi:unnamed protein product [Spodoptera exigua]|nr:unnamed protein product [Spodoptera exigua]
MGRSMLDNNKPIEASFSLMILNLPNDTSPAPASPPGPMALARHLGARRASLCRLAAASTCCEAWLCPRRLLLRSECCIEFLLFLSKSSNLNSPCVARKGESARLSRVHVNKMRCQAIQGAVASVAASVAPMLIGDADCLPSARLPTLVTSCRAGLCAAWSSTSRAASLSRYGGKRPLLQLRIIQISAGFEISRFLQSVSAARGSAAGAGSAVSAAKTLRDVKWFVLSKLLPRYCGMGRVRLQPPTSAAAATLCIVHVHTYINSRLWSLGSALAADVPRAATRDSRLITPLVRISRKPTSDVWQAPALEINVDSGNVDGLASPWLALLRDNVSRHSGTRRAT